MAITETDKRDIQGIIVSGYSHLSEACFVLVAIENGARAKLWLERIIDQLGFASEGQERPSMPTLNIAFTSLGLQTLGFEKIRDPEKAEVNCLETPIWRGSKRFTSPVGSLSTIPNGFCSSATMMGV